MAMIAVAARRSQGHRCFAYQTSPACPRSPRLECPLQSSTDLHFLSRKPPGLTRFSYSRAMMPTICGHGLIF